MDNNEKTFTYSYSAKEQSEVAHIRQKYLPPEEDKMELLRRLDHSASRKALAWSLALGIPGALILGTGMSLAMTELGNALGGFSMLTGTVTGLIGMALMALAYPVYNHILKREQKRIAPEILRLTEELMK